jgi:hypothetical protein
VSALFSIALRKLIWRSQACCVYLPNPRTQRRNLVSTYRPQSRPRIAAKFSMTRLGSRHSCAGHVHLYACNPKASAITKAKGANKGTRVFARALNLELHFSSSSFERMLVDALTLGLCSMKFTGDNPLFLCCLDVDSPPIAIRLSPATPQVSCRL